MHKNEVTVRIPSWAKKTESAKKGYKQVSYTWQQDGWSYQARWHEKTPLAKLIDYPSWRLDRIKPGKGFGPKHRHRIHQILVGRSWLKARCVFYAAKCLNDGKADAQQVRIIKYCHFR